MDFSKIFNDRKDVEYLYDLEELYILALKIFKQYENEFSKPVCIIIKAKESQLFKLSRMIHSLFLIKKQISLETLLPVDSIGSLSNFSIADEEGKYDYLLCNISIMLDIILLVELSKDILQVVIEAMLKKLYEKNCSIINYVTTESELEDKLRFFRKTGYQVEIFDTNEIKEYTRDKYQSILQDLQFTLTILTWREMIENSENPNYIKEIAMKSINILDLGFTLEQINFDELLESNKI